MLSDDATLENWTKISGRKFIYMQKKKNKNKHTNHSKTKISVVLLEI